MTHPPLLTRVLAVVAPCFVLAGAAVGAGAFSSVEQTLPSLEDIGHVGYAFMVRPDVAVVIAGNSQAYSAVDATALGEALHTPKGVGLATTPGVTAAATYAILKYRVFGAGARPKLVILPMSLQHLLDVSVPTGVNLGRLQDHLPGSDPVIDEKVYGRSAGLLPKGVALAQSELQARRDAWFEQLTTLPLRLTHAEDPAAVMDRARDAVLGEVAGSNLAISVQVMPTGAAPVRLSVAASVAPEQTLLPDLIALCKEYGAQLVVATVPQKQSVLAAPAETVRRTADWLQTRGVPFLNFEAVEFPADGWLDAGHLAGPGQRMFTELLANKLLEVDALSGGELKMPSLPLPPPRITRHGELAPPVELGRQLSPDGCLLKIHLAGATSRSDASTSALGLWHASVLQATVDGAPVTPHAEVTAKVGCANQMWHSAESVTIALPYVGAQPVLSWADVPSSRRSTLRSDVPLTHDILWAAPGTTLTFAWDEPLPATAVSVFAIGLTAGTNPPSLRMGDAVIPLQPWGNLWYARLPMPAAGVNAPIGLVVPEGGPELFVRLVSVEDADGVHAVHGHPPDVGWALPMAGGSFIDVKPALPADPVATVSVREQDTLVFQSSGPLTALTQSVLKSSISDRRFSSCMPLGGRHNVTGEYRDGVVQLEPGKLLLRGVKDDAWSVVWRSKRSCFQRNWVLPGETVSFTPRLSRAIFVTSDSVYLDIAGFPAAGNAQVAVIVDGVQVLNGEIDLAGERPVTLALNTPVGANPTAVTLQVTAPAASFLSVGLSELRPSQIPAEAWFARDQAAMSAELPDR